MSVNIPNPMGIKLSGSLGSVGPINIGTLPKLQLSMDKLQVGLDKLQVGLDKLQIGMDPLTVHVGLAEVPRIRVHLPAHYSFGLKLMGVELLCFQLCGEAQMITEPYVPRPTEQCGGTKDLHINPNVVGKR